MKSIDLTGGPCSGKSTSLCFLREKLTEQLLNPILVPEAASLIIGAGVSPLNLKGEEMIRFQENLLKTKRHLEKTLRTLARNYPNPVLICDRGCMDAKAY